MELNQVITGDSLKVLKQFPEASVDLFMFAPPFDNAKLSKDQHIDLSELGRQLSRILKPGGVCVYNTQDKFVNGSKSGTSFRTVLDWHDNTGLRLWNDFIYWRRGRGDIFWKLRPRVDHDYVFVLTNRSNRPKHFDKTVRTDKQGKCLGTVLDYREYMGELLRRVPKGDDFMVPFPLKFAEDMIAMFTVPGDTVADPFCGIGTVLNKAQEMGRFFIGIELKEIIAEFARKELRKKRNSLGVL